MVIWWQNTIGKANATMVFSVTYHTIIWWFWRQLHSVWKSLQNVSFTKSYFYLNFKRKFAFLKRWSSIPSTTGVPFMWDSISGYKGFSDLDHSFGLVSETLTVRIGRIIIHFVGKYMFVARWYVSIFHNISSPTNWQTIKIKKPIYKNVSFSVRRHKNFEDILQVKFNVREVQ